MNWMEIYDQECPALFSFLLSRGARREEAEDVIHEVFAAAITANARPESPRAYLFASSRRALGRIREKAGSAVELTDKLMENLVTQAPAGLDVEVVNASLARLPAVQREVVVLHVWHGLGFREIGEALEISADTAASRWRYAAEKLRNILGPALGMAS